MIEPDARPSTSSEARKAYADRFSESLRVFTNEVGQYACPLCLTRFPVSAVSTLTWDHYPPRSIGGRASDTVLVCGDCQRRWDAIDADVDRLKKRAKFEANYPDAVPAVLQLPGVHSIRGLSHRVALRVSGNTVEIIGRTEKNPDHVTDRLVQFLHQLSSTSDVSGLSINVQSDTGEEYSPSRVALAFLKAAYLAAFNCLGYPYILADELAAIRQQMLDPQLDVFRNRPLIITPPSSEIQPQIILGYVHEPESLTSLAVFFIGYYIRPWCAVLLPLPAHPGLPDYANIDQLVHEISQIGIVTFDRHINAIYDPEVVLVDQNDNQWPIYKQK